MCLPLLLGICLSLTVLVFALQSGIVTFLMAVLISIFILAIGIWLIDLHSQGYFHWMFYRLTEPSGDRMPANWDGTVPFAPAPSSGVSSSLLPAEEVAASSGVPRLRPRELAPPTIEES